MEDDPYADAALYDLEYNGHQEDLTYYVDLSRSAKGPILELGCGTGRLTLPMAREGAHVDGIDRAPGMLEGLRLKLASESAAVQARVRFWEGDFREPGPDARASYAWVIWPFNAIHHCRGPADVLKTLLDAKARLAPGGQIALDLYLPDRELYDRDPSRTYEHRVFKDPRTGQPLHTWEQGWWDEENRMHHVVYTYKQRSGIEERAHLHLRMFEREEIHQILSEADLRITHSASDFRDTPLEKKSLKWVLRLMP